MIHGMDRGIGRILDALKASGQLDNTLIVFTSDNGGPGGGRGDGPSSNGPLRGWKFLHYEGGVRVAAAMAWPAGLKPRAQAGIGAISYVDLLPTLATLAGAKVDKPVDGHDLSAALRSGKRPAGERTLFVGEDYRVAPQYGERGPNDPESRAGRARSVIVGKWKIVGDQLFDIEADPFEKRDVAAEHPDIVKRLQGTAAGFIALRTISRDKLNATHLPPLPLWELPKQ